MKLDLILYLRAVCKILTLLTITICVIACDDKQNNNQLDADTHEQVNQLFRQIAKDLPGNNPPKYYSLEDKSLYKLVSVTKENHLVLDNNKELILAGLSCHVDSLNLYLKAMLQSLNNKNRLAVEYTGLKSGDLEYAYVWLVSFYGEKLTANSSHNLNEAVMTTGYCSAIEQEKHKYYERYAGLEEIGEVLKKYRSNL